MTASRLLVKFEMEEPDPFHSERETERFYEIDLMARQIEKITKRASELLADDDALRMTAGLLHPSDISIVTAGLWPALFELWEESGRRVAYTPGGPLYRFLAIVHAACDLPEPKQGTFKDAVTRWKDGGRRVSGG